DRRSPGAARRLIRVDAPLTARQYDRRPRGQPDYAAHVARRTAQRARGTPNHPAGHGWSERRRQSAREPGERRRADPGPQRARITEEVPRRRAGAPAAGTGVSAVSAAP